MNRQISNKSFLVSFLFNISISTLSTLPDWMIMICRVVLHRYEIILLADNSLVRLALLPLLVLAVESSAQEISVNFHVCNWLAAFILQDCVVGEGILLTTNEAISVLSVVPIFDRVHNSACLTLPLAFFQFNHRLRW